MTSHALARALIAFAFATGAAEARDEPRLVPRPASLEFARGAFSLPARLTATSQDASAQRFAERAAKACGLAVDVVQRAPADIVFAPRESTTKHVPESYALTVGAKGVEIRASDAAGFVHGTSTLLQLACGAQKIPAMTIDDAPQFRWRGVMLDSARHYQSPEYLRRFLDAMALHKLNVLHWHLTDDQAWRLEIRKYPKLTDIGAWRVPAGEAPLRDLDPATGEPRRYGGFYSQQTVRELVSYAQTLGITIVPEIEMPGHASAAIAAYPELGAAAGAVPRVPADWGIYPNAFAQDEATFAFLEDVLRETMALFPSKYVHIGGDEVEPTQWLAAGETGDGHAIQARFTNRIAAFLEAQGRIPVGWDEILSPGLAKNAVVMSWRGVDGAVQAAAQGHDTVLSAWPTLYFDNRQSDALDEPPGRTKVVSLRDVYAFDPLPASIGAAQRSHVLGVQGAVWTEHIRTEERVDHMAFPRLAAIAELGWTPPARRGWKDFVRRLPVLRPLYDGLGVRAARSAFDGRAAGKPGDSRESRELALCGEAIPIVVEDDGPVRGERAKFAVDLQNPCWFFRGADLRGVAGLDLRIGQIPFNYQIGKAREGIVLAKPVGEGVELEVRQDRCDGELLARVPVGAAAEDGGVSTLQARFAARAGTHDLCLRFAQATLDPLWVIERATLVRP